MSVTEVAESRIDLVELDPTGEDRSSLVEFLSGNEWPFHVRQRLAKDDVEKDIDDGLYRDADHRSYWLQQPALGRIGYVRLEDLSDPTPLFDIRLASAFRGRGFGVIAVRATTDHVFSSLTSVTRFEGQTREDNIAMRRVFLRCGWVKEAHYRESWPVSEGAPVASIAYSILRRDWETGETTSLDWADLTL